jgi:hypothetical protein
MRSRCAIRKPPRSGGYLRVPDRCRGYGVQPDVDAAAWPRALSAARRWPVRPRAGASCTEAAPPRRHEVGFGHQWRVRRDDPAVGQVPALHRLVPQAEVGRVGELQVGALLDALTIALSEDMPPARRKLVYTTSEVIRELVAA